MISSVERWSHRDAAHFVLEPKTLKFVLLAVILSAISLLLFPIESRLPWLIGLTWIFVTPLFMRANLMTRSDFNRATYLSKRESRERSLDIGVSMLGTAIGVVLMVGVPLTFGVLPDSTILLSRPRTALNTGVWLSILTQVIGIMAAGFVGGQIAFFVRTREFFEGGVAAFMGLEFIRQISTTD